VQGWWLPLHQLLYGVAPGFAEVFKIGGRTAIDKSGRSHQIAFMAMATLKPSKGKKGISVLRSFDIAADAKNRISLRGAKSKYFHVKALSNGCYVLEPRMLVSPDAIPARTLRMLESSVARLKKGKASAPIDLSPFLKD